MTWHTLARRAVVAMALALICGSALALSQSNLSSFSATANAGIWENASSSRDEANTTDPSERGLPSVPGPAGYEGGYDRYEAKPAAYWHQRPISRVGFGADVSLLGIGFKSALELSQNFDLRVLGNYFSYPDAHFKVDGFDVTGDVHFASASASLDWYPFANGSIFRISPGVMFLNQNGLTASGGIAGGTDFKLGDTTYYSASENPATGAKPLTGTGGVSLHRNTPALTATAGFGSFVPRSNRHWSFPSEFGVIFTGSPVVNMHLSGWVCTDKEQTQCSNVGDAHSPIAAEFNQDLNGRIQHWQAQADKIRIYPVFSYSVMYSFNIPGR